MARDKGDDSGKRRWGRGKPEEGPSDEDLGWLADLRASRDDRPLGDEPRSRRATRPADEPPTGSISRPAPPPGPPPGAPDTPPVSPAPQPPAEPRSRGFLRRTPSTPPPAPPPVPPVPAPPLRPPTGSPRQMLDWSDETGELPAPEPRGRLRDLRTGDVRLPPAPPPGLRAGGRTEALRPPGPATPPGPAPLPGPGPAAMPGPAPLPGPGPAPMPGPAPLPALPMPGGAADSMTTGMIRRAELRKHMKIQQQLKGATLILVVILLLAAYPFYLFARTFAADPVFSGLDDLSLPSWAAYEHADYADGSRWCIGECRYRTRTYYSERSPEETQLAYNAAFQEDGWRLRPENCQGVAEQGAEDGSRFSCWAKDQYVMIMHIREPLCEVPPSREPIPGVSPTVAQAPTTPTCPGALVSVYISYAIDEQPQF